MLAGGWDSLTRKTMTMEEPPALPTATDPPQPAQPRQPAMSLTARLLNVFAVPGEVFDDVKASVPSISNWLAPAFLYVIVGCVGVWLMYSQPAVQQQMQEMQDQMIQKMVDKGMMTKDVAEKQQAGSAVGMKIGPYLAPLFGAFLSPVLWALVLWIVGLKVFKAKFEYMKALEVTGLANAIAVLGDIVHTLLVVGLGNMFASASPTLLMNNADPQNPTFAVAAVFNITAIWMLAVRAIGLSKLCGVPFVRAAFWVFGLWFAWMAVIIGISLAIKSAFGF